MSTAEQLSFNQFQPELSEQAILDLSFRDASGIVQHVIAYGEGLEETFGQRYFMFENHRHRATDSALMSILEVEATKVFEDDQATVYKVGDAYIFREEQFYDPGVVGGALYTGYIDSA